MTYAPKQKCACCATIKTESIVSRFGLELMPALLAAGVKVLYTHSPKKKRLTSVRKVATGWSKRLPPSWTASFGVSFMSKNGG